MKYGLDCDIFVVDVIYKGNFLWILFYYINHKKSQMWWKNIFRILEKFNKISFLGDVIPQDYTLIDVAYYYKWEKDSPMQFFYRIFKKNKVLLKRRKRKSRNEDKISDGKKPRPVECTNNTTNSKGKSILKLFEKNFKLQ